MRAVTLKAGVSDHDIAVVMKRDGRSQETGPGHGNGGRARLTARQAISFYQDAEAHNEAVDPLERPRK